VWAGKEGKRRGEKEGKKRSVRRDGSHEWRREGSGDCEIKVGSLVIEESGVSKSSRQGANRRGCL